MGALEALYLGLEHDTSCGDARRMAWALAWRGCQGKPWSLLGEVS